MRIANERSNSIWGDSWLLSEGSDCIITRRPMVTAYQDKVEELIDWNTCSWKQHLIEHKSLLEHKYRILQVPISISSSEE